MPVTKGFEWTVLVTLLKLELAAGRQPCQY